MKSSLAILCGLCLATATPATAQGIVWTADSLSAFDLTVTGTGGFFNGTPATSFAGWG